MGSDRLRRIGSGGGLCREVLGTTVTARPLGPYRPLRQGAMPLNHRSEVPSFDVRRVSEAGAIVIEVTGELDIATVPELDRAFAEASRGQGPLLVDLCATSFVDSTGLHSLLAARHRITAQGRRFALASPAGGQFAQLLEMTGSDQAFVCFADRVTALEALRA